MPTEQNNTANNALTHSKGGTHPRGIDDGGVPMTQGTGAEPVGPEDAFSTSALRGNYAGRIGASVGQGAGNFTFEKQSDGTITKIRQDV